jgi:hypothetical protein
LGTNAREKPLSNDGKAGQEDDPSAGIPLQPGKACCFTVILSEVAATHAQETFCFPFPFLFSFLFPFFDNGNRIV